MGRYQNGGAASAIKSIQTGRIVSATGDGIESLYTGVNSAYKDITISSVEINKCIVEAGNGGNFYRFSAGSEFTNQTQARLLNSTTLRLTFIGVANTSTFITGSWRVVEYN